MELGLVFSHRTLSVTPEASCAQALDTAGRPPSSGWAAEAVRQSRPPLKLTHTRQLWRSWRKVEKTITPRTRATNAMASQVVFFMRRNSPFSGIWRSGAPPADRARERRIRLDTGAGIAAG